MVAEVRTGSTDLEDSAQAERQLLGACLRCCEYDDAGLDDVAAVVAVADFYSYAHQVTFRAMLELRAAGSPVSAATVYEHLRERGELVELGDNPGGWLADLLTVMPTGAMAQHFAERVREYARRRSIRRAASEIVAETRLPRRPASDMAAACERILHDATAESATSGPRSMAELVADELNAIDTRHEHGPEGLPTGLRDLDRFLNGMRAGQSIVIGARPAVGKTSLALSIAANVAAGGAPVLFVSLEMPADEITQRLLASRSGVRLNVIRAGTVDDEQAGKITAAAGVVRRLPLTIDDTPNVTVDRLAAVARRAVRRDGLRLLVVDYLQLITPENPRENRNAQVGLLARRLKLLARELRIPVMVLCQLNRESENRPDPEPRLSDLRDSGEIEQHADNVVLLHPQRGQPEGPRQLVDALVKKNRNGPPGKAPLSYVGPLTRFDDAN